MTLDEALERFRAGIPYMTIDELKAALKEVKAALRYLYERSSSDR